MNNFMLKAYEDKLNHQVIHMDQALCYCPEYLATGMMHDYPSRRLQLARAVFTGELEANEFIANRLFQCILSRQGERWQNFREDPEDFTDVVILCRQMMQERGFGSELADAFESLLKTNAGHTLPVGDTAASWRFEGSIDPGSGDLLLIDDATAYYAAQSAGHFADWLKDRGWTFKGVTEPEFLGFEYFALGLTEAGADHLKALVARLNAQGAERVLVLSAQAAWMLRTMTKKLDIVPSFEVVYLPEILETLKAPQPAYVYAGSFNLRYLDESARLNDLFANTQEERVANCVEFIPLVSGDVRLNTLTRWQRPLGPEYTCFGVPADMLSAIGRDAVNDIEKAGAPAFIVCEPTALPVIKKAYADQPVYYYLDLL
jgi:hypothetical protein